MISSFHARFNFLAMLFLYHDERYLRKLLKPASDELFSDEPFSHDQVFLDLSLMQNPKFILSLIRLAPVTRSDQRLRETFIGFIFSHLVHSQELFFSYKVLLRRYLSVSRALDP